MRIYISGAISSDTEAGRLANIACAEAAAETLIGMDHAVYCPHRLSRAWGERQLSVPQYNRLIVHDLEWVGICDAILMLEGWKQSDGATEEHAYATDLHKRIYLAIEDVPGPPLPEVCEVLEILATQWGPREDNPLAVLARVRMLNGFDRYGIANHLKPTWSVRQEVTEELIDAMNLLALERHRRQGQDIPSWLYHTEDYILASLECLEGADAEVHACQQCGEALPAPRRLHLALCESCRAADKAEVTGVY